MISKSSNGNKKACNILQNFHLKCRSYAYKLFDEILFVKKGNNSFKKIGQIKLLIQYANLHTVIIAGMQSFEEFQFRLKL